MSLRQSFDRVETLAFIRELMPTAWVRWIGYVLLWTFIATLSAIHWYEFFYFPDPYESFHELWLIKMELWFAFALLTPLILLLAAHFELGRERWLGNFLVLFFYSIVATVAYSAVYTLLLLVFLDRNITIISYANSYIFVISQHSTFYYLAFWALVAMEHGFRWSRRLRERELQASQLEAQLATAKFEALRSHIQPHFLFNALNTITSMIEDDQPERARDTVQRLSELLRLSLDHSRTQFVTLDREMQFVREYLALMQSRYPDRLQLRIAVPDDVLQARVPSLILQPIVENAIKYGVAASAEPGCVDVSALKEDSWVIVTVKNEGPRVLPDQVSHTGMGLPAVRSRLEHLYGADYQFSFEPRDQGGAVVSISVPIQPQD